jgi:hypothetical protein
LRLNDGALKSTSECSIGNVNQSLKKASLTQAYLEFKLWQIDSRIVAMRVARRSDLTACCDSSGREIPTRQPPNRGATHPWSW